MPPSSLCWSLRTQRRGRRAVGASLLHLWRLFLLWEAFSDLACLDLLKKTTESVMGPVLHQINLSYKKKNILVPVLFQLSLKFLPLSPHGHLSELPGSFRSDKSIGFGFKERSSLSLRATRRCYWAAAWTGNFRGLAHIHTVHARLFIWAQHNGINAWIMNVVDEH